MSSSDILEVLGDCCDRQPKLFLDCPPDGLDRQAQLDSSRPFAVEAREWIRENGDEDPAGWLGRIVVSYLAEASHQLSVMALLLKNRAVHATLDPLIRAVLERCGRVCWLLDPDATASQRSARTQLELGVCAHHYAETLSLVDAAEETRTEVRQWRGQHRTRVHTRYSVDTNGQKKDMSGWSVNGETYPNYTGTVAYRARSAPAIAGRVRRSQRLLAPERLLRSRAPRADRGHAERHGDAHGCDRTQPADRPGLTPRCRRAMGFVLPRSGTRPHGGSGGRPNGRRPGRGFRTSGSAHLKRPVDCPSE